MAQRNCPVKGFQVRGVTWTVMRVHFLHINVRYTVVILEEDSLPHPGFPRCNMIFPWTDLNGQHVTTTQCAKGSEQKRWRLEEEEIRESKEKVFPNYNKPLAMVTSFKYLGQVLTLSDEKWTTVVGNLWKTRTIWAWLETRLAR